MEAYSSLFSVLHDQPEPVGRLGRGTHVSVMRTVVWLPDARFHDFCIVWDEDHDRRIIGFVERMIVAQLMSSVLFVGERKGSVTVLTSCPSSPGFASAVLAVAQDVPNDPWGAEVKCFPEVGTIVNDDLDRVSAYLGGVRALWHLGTKPVTLR